MQERLAFQTTNTGELPGNTNDPATAKPLGLAVNISSATVKTGGDVRNGGYGMGTDWPFTTILPSVARLRVALEIVTPLPPGTTVEPAKNIPDAFAVTV